MSAQSGRCSCVEANCPWDICGTQITLAITYDNGAQETDHTANACAAINCCNDLTACADPSGDGFLEMGDPEVDACLLCLVGDPGCAAGAVKTSADAYSACVDANCP